MFCAIVDGAAPAHMVDADEHTIAFMDINPATPGHVLVIPRRHCDDLWDMPPDLAAPLMTAAHRIALWIRDRLQPDGLNLLHATRRAAWQSVFHLHLHLIPRYRDDPLIRPWRPRPGNHTEMAALAARIRGDS